MTEVAIGAVVAGVAMVWGWARWGWQAGVALGLVVLAVFAVDAARRGMVEVAEVAVVVDVHDGPGVYILAADDVARVKIGMSGDTASRVADLQTASPVPLRLVGVIPTRTRAEAVELEAELHDRFARQRVRGEWFRVEGDLAAWVNDMEAVR